MLAKQHLAHQATDGPGAGLARGNCSPSCWRRCSTSRSVCVVVPEPSMLPRRSVCRGSRLLSPWPSSTTNPRACRARAILYSCIVSSPRGRQPTGYAPAKLGPCVAVALLFALPACKRSVQVSSARPADVTAASPRGVLCVEQPDACLYCVGREGEAPFLEAFQSRPRVCDPKDAEECVEFCSALAPACALPWTPEPHCVLDSELAFHRALFNRDTADRPE